MISFQRWTGLFFILKMIEHVFCYWFVKRNIQNRNRSLLCWNRNWNRDTTTGIEIRIGIKVFWETLESESESESLATGIGIGIGIMDFDKPWNRNQNRNQPTSGIGVIIGIIIKICSSYENHMSFSCMGYFLSLISHHNCYWKNNSQIIMLCLTEF